LEKLRIDFYESGVGETIVITFPSGGLGLVDAHPSQHSFRPEIQELVHGKKLHFVCLTHPHADHGVDLVTVLQSHQQIEAFWHTVFDIPALIYGVEQTVNFPSEVREYASKMNQDWGEFLFDIFAAVIDRKIERHPLRSDLEPLVIEGIEIHCLSPDQSVLNAYFSAYKDKLTDPMIELPNPNSISAVLALRLGQGVVLLGADALKKNWATAVTRYQKRSLPKARIFKVPHHGGKDALDLQHRAKNYLDICSHAPNAKAVIFAGDAKHPNADVFNKLRLRTDTLCLSNGRKATLGNTNPLRLQLPGARAVYPAPICNPIISFEIDEGGKVNVLAGVRCEEGCTTQHPLPPHTRRQ